MEIFNKQATVGDVIGWIVTIPMILTTITIGPMTPRIIGNFHLMFDALHGQLPTVTKLVLGIPNWFLPIPLMALAIGSTWIMFKTKDNIIKALIPVLFLWLWASYIGMLFYAIYYPILELQSAVKGG